VGQSGHLSMELIRSMTGINVVYVPYKTIGLAVTDLLAGRVGVQISNLPAHLDNVKSGKLRALGVTSAKRSSRLPEVPAIAETLPGFDLTVWYGLCAPAGVSKAIVRKINADVVRALDTPDTQRRLEQHGVDPSSSTPEQFAAFIKAETVKWAKVVKDAGIPPQ
jgi:tripartite-type tricarboxylate transporter receptor subunit TctC